jgi:hypothetical protein
VVVVDVLGLSVLGVPVLGLSVLGVPVLGASVLGVPVLGASVLGVPVLGASVLGVPVLGLSVLGVPVLGASVLPPVAVVVLVELPVVVCFGRGVLIAGIDGPLPGGRTVASSATMWTGVAEGRGSVERLIAVPSAYAPPVNSTVATRTATIAPRRRALIVGPPP